MSTVETPYNHHAVEKKWRKKWEENPINVDDGKKEKSSEEEQKNVNAKESSDNN